MSRRQSNANSDRGTEQQPKRASVAPSEARARQQIKEREKSINHFDFTPPDVITRMWKETL